MADNLNSAAVLTGRVNVNQEHENCAGGQIVVTEEQLKEAVKIAGPIADEVQQPSGQHRQKILLVSKARQL